MKTTWLEQPHKNATYYYELQHPNITASLTFNSKNDPNVWVLRSEALAGRRKILSNISTRFEACQVATNVLFGIK